MGKILKISNLKKTIRYLKKNGVRQAYYAMKERMHEVAADYYTYAPPAELDIREQTEGASKFTYKFSILVPAFETKEEYLRAMLDSVLQQTYHKFELILADASVSDCVEKVTGEYQDNRIIYKRLGQNGGISANTNQALMYATGDYAGLLDHDDVLTRDALYEMACCIYEHEQRDVELQLLYSDEDKCNSDESSYYEVNKKVEFNLDLILSNNYICHFLVMKRQMMQELGFRTVCDGAQDYDMILRAVNSMLGKDKKRNKKKELPIAHIPKVLYHWRCHENSTAQNPASKQYAYDAGKRSVEDFLRAREWKGTVNHLRHLGFYRVNYQPNLFANRPDTAVVGGKLLNRDHKIIGGIYSADKEPMYLGLHKEYSGYLHRASLAQEAYMIDIRCMAVAPEAEAVMEEIIGLPYLRNPQNGRFDWQDSLNSHVNYIELSNKFCQKIRERGWRIVWDPGMTEKILSEVK